MPKPGLFWLAIIGIIAIGELGGCAAAIPFVGGAAVGTIVSNQHNAPPPSIPPRPLR